VERRDGSDPTQRPYLSVLIRLFGGGFSLPRLFPWMLSWIFHQIVEDAEAEFLTFFATKTVSSIRAPDEFVYPAPFNLVEAFIAPFE